MLLLQVIFFFFKKKKKFFNFLFYSFRKELQDSSYFEEAGGRSVCDDCFSSKMAKLSVNDTSSTSSSSNQKVEQKSHGKCNSCNQDIFLKSMTAKGKVYHDTCFKCLKCSTLIKNGDAFFTRDNGVICENCG